MPRAGSGSAFYEWRIIRREQALRGVETIHKYLIQPEVWHESKAVVRRHFYQVWVRRLLPLRVLAFPRMLHPCGCFPQPSAIENGNTSTRPP